MVKLSVNTNGCITLRLEMKELHVDLWMRPVDSKWMSRGVSGPLGSSLALRRGRSMVQALISYLTSRVGLGAERSREADCKAEENVTVCYFL